MAADGNILHRWLMRDVGLWFRWTAVPKRHGLVLVWGYCSVGDWHNRRGLIAGLNSTIFGFFLLFFLLIVTNI